MSDMTSPADLARLLAELEAQLRAQGHAGSHDHMAAKTLSAQFAPLRVLSVEAIEAAFALLHRHRKL